MSNSKYLYKYLRVNRAKDLFYKGKVHFKNAAYFCSKEEDGIRGDKYDGSEIFSNTITIKNSSGEQVVSGKAFTVRSQEELKTIYIFCVSKILSPDFFDRFDSNCCVTIKDIDEFKNRIINNTNCINLDLKKRFFSSITKKIKIIQIRVSFKTNLICDDIIYFDDSKIEDVITIKTDIKQQFFHKRKSLYEWQQEYRFLLEPKGEITIHCLKEDKEFLNKFKKHNSLSVFELFPTGINLNIGSMEDIAEIEIAKK